MYETNYHRASSVADAAKLIKKCDDGKLLSGGMTLIPTMKQRLASPSDLDRPRAHRRHERRQSVGQKSHHRRGDDPCGSGVQREAARRLPAFADLASHIGDPHVRHRGTIGGSIANNDPAADYPSAMLALDATIVTDKRSIPADKFFKGLFETSLKDGEIVTAIEFTAPAKAAYSKFPNPASRYAMTGVFVAKQKDGARVAVTGAGDDGVFRHKGLEAALNKKFAADALGDVAVASKGLMSDMHASADYRAALIKVMAKRAVAAAG